MKRTLSFCLVILLIFFCSKPVSAIVTEDTEMYGNEIAPPSDFDFSQQEHCSGHRYFLQAAAQEDGKFIICTHYVNERGVSEETYRRQYIDVYNFDGSFNSELSFFSTQPYVAEIKDDCINIYFYSYMIAFEIETKDMRCFDIPDAYVSENAAYDTLRQTTFTSGHWNYKCTDRMSSGYRCLTRQNGETVQEVIRLTDTNNNYTIILTGGCIGVIATCFLVIVHKKKQQREHGE